MEARGAGFIACFQDNGENRRYHQELLAKIEGEKLHSIQFRELCARFYYSGYLFSRVPQYLVYPPDEAKASITVETMPLQSAAATSALFGRWDNKEIGRAHV